MSALPDPTQRFTARAEEYVRWRPDYPPEVVAFWVNHFGWQRGSTILDAGSGTGIMSALLLDAGMRVLAVEPNSDMRVAAEERFAGHAFFESVPGSAEDTMLPDGSADGAVAAQAFHWFDPEKTRAELLRVLRPPCEVGIVWNVRQTESTPFLRHYEALLHEWGTDYAAVQRRQAHPEESLSHFFEHGAIVSTTFPNEQRFGYEGLEGRLLSCSYVPKKGDAAFAPMLKALRRLFDEHQEAGEVAFRYDVRVYAGTLR